ncbi:MAG: hypothetical protein CMB56_002355 [Methanobacteriota archaeon]|nr:MAG: hypothetical protein CMB56_002355 [Euryarchaeota archaeon]|tara:strand:+ start:21956 stop:23152 length:1197 start_codon:yes stop_codon:yes gene_type:complete
MLHKFHHNLKLHKEDLDLWFKEKYKIFKLPIYGSVDVRYSGWKVSVVDANYFPAGFNNLSEDHDIELSEKFKKYIYTNHGLNIKNIHIYPENHTRNPGYVENIVRLKKIISNADFIVTVGSPELNRFELLEGISEDLVLDSVSLENDLIQINGQSPDLILLNNDLTGGLISGLNGRVEPSKEMGWYKRKKSDHYECLENLVKEVSEILDLDPWFLLPMWFVSEDKCLDLEACKKKLARDIDLMISRIKDKYKEYNIKSEPKIFVKNNSGTYGLGITTLSSGDEINSLSNRIVKRLTYGKGGHSSQDFLIQEGIPTSLIQGDLVMEPVGYTIAGEKSFWFFRTNHKKNNLENLNSPSSNFMQFDQIKMNLKKSELLDWFNLVSKLSYLAMGMELQRRDY